MVCADTYIHLHVGAYTPSTLFVCWPCHLPGSVYNEGMTHEKTFIGAVLALALLLGLTGCTGRLGQTQNEWRQLQVATFCQETKLASWAAHHSTPLFDGDACHARYRAGQCWSDAECAAFFGEAY